MAGRTGISKALNLVDGAKLAATKIKIPAPTFMPAGTDLSVKGLANRASQAQEKGHNIEHAQTTLQDYTTKKFGAHTKYEDLSTPQREEIHERIHRDKVADGIHKGKKYENLSDSERVLADTQLTADRAAGTHRAEGEHLHQESKQKMSNRDYLAMGIRNGTWDVRNLANIKGAGFHSPTTAGGTVIAAATAGFAQAIRAGFKGVNIDVKQSDKTVATDMKSMFDHLLTSVKLAGAKVPESGHKPDANDDHGKKGGH
jgi:hypothetical protein